MVLLSIAASIFLLASGFTARHFLTFKFLPLPAEKELQKARAEHEAFSRAHEDFRQAHEQAIADYENFRQAAARRLSQAVADHEGFRQAHANHISELQKDHAKAVTDLRQDHEKVLVDLRQAHEDFRHAVADHFAEYPNLSERQIRERAEGFRTLKLGMPINEDFRPYSKAWLAEQSAAKLEEFSNGGVCIKGQPVMSRK